MSLLAPALSVALQGWWLRVGILDVGVGLRYTLFSSALLFHTLEELGIAGILSFSQSFVKFEVLGLGLGVGGRSAGRQWMNGRHYLEGSFQQGLLADPVVVTV